MSDLAAKFEATMELKAVRVVGVLVTGVVLALSAGLAVAAKQPVRPLVLKPVLPDEAPNLSVLRWLPLPDRRVEALHETFPTPYAKVRRVAAASPLPLLARSR
ncbi:MAG: hypothetical protein INH41_28045 [Myxococcaceae bacterium]|nr:hypothetical protein [Myxococcaceae bacterium]MCA3016254.1 hypothetical protein [Myxococcaceae bacterium]